MHPKIRDSFESVFIYLSVNVMGVPYYILMNSTHTWYH